MNEKQDILLGGYTIQEREEYLAKKTEEYILRHPANSSSGHRKRKYARVKWRRKLKREGRI